MKKALFRTVLLSAVFLFSACVLDNPVEYYYVPPDEYIIAESCEDCESVEIEPDAIVSYYELADSLSTFQISEGITLSIIYVTRDFLTEFESYSKFIDTGSFEIAFITSIPLRDFRLIKIDGAEIEFVVVEELYFLDELLPDTPFVTTWNARGSMPHRGISFVDENDAVRYFAFHYCARGGYDYFRIQEFETPQI